MKQGYIIARSKTANVFFTSTSGYDTPKFIDINEATVYPTAELAQLAASKLWKYGVYSASVRPLSENGMPPPQLSIPPEPVNPQEEIADQEIGIGDDEQLDNPEDQMTAGEGDGFEVDDVNFDDDHIETYDSDEDLEDLDVDDEMSLEEPDVENQLEPEEDFEEENEVSFETPIERNVRQGRHSTMPNGNGPRVTNESQYRENLRNTQGNISLTKPKTKGGHSGDGNKGSAKVTDAEVSEMRTMYQYGKKSKQDIRNKWPNLSNTYIDSLLRYQTRLTPACEPKKPIKESGIPTDVTTIKYKQNIQGDFSYAADVEELHNPRKTPTEILQALRDDIKDFEKVYEYNNGKDDSQASMALTIASAMKDLLMDLEQGTQEGLVQAQIRLQSYMGPILTNLPTCVKDYLYKSGRQPISLKNIFYDKWNGLKESVDPGILIKPTIIWGNMAGNTTIRVTYEYEGEVIDGPYVHTNKNRRNIDNIIDERYGPTYFTGECVGKSGPCRKSNRPFVN